MDPHFAFLLIMLLIGFVFAGGLIEAIGSFTHERIGFDLMFRHGRRGWLAAPLLFMAGPALVLQAAFARFRTEGAASALGLAGIAIAALWAVASGHMLFRIITFVAPLYSRSGLIAG